MIDKIQEFLNNKYGTFLEEALMVETTKVFDVYATGKVLVVNYDHTTEMIQNDLSALTDAQLIDIMDSDGMWDGEDSSNWINKKKTKFNGEGSKKQSVVEYVERFYSDRDTIISYLEDNMFTEFNTILLNNRPYLIGFYDLVADKLIKYFGPKIDEEVNYFIKEKTKGMKPIRLSESLPDNMSIINSNDLDDNWNVSSHVNKKAGRKPYLLRGYKAVPAQKGHELTKAVYMTEKDAALLNALGNGITDLIAKYNEKKAELVKDPNKSIKKDEESN